LSKRWLLLVAVCYYNICLVLFSLSVFCFFCFFLFPGFCVSFSFCLVFFLLPTLTSFGFLYYYSVLWTHHQHRYCCCLCCCCGGCSTYWSCLFARSCREFIALLRIWRLSSTQGFRFCLKFFLRCLCLSVVSNLVVYVWGFVISENWFFFHSELGRCGLVVNLCWLLQLWCWICSAELQSRDFFFPPYCGIVYLLSLPLSGARDRGRRALWESLGSAVCDSKTISSLGDDRACSRRRQGSWSPCCRCGVHGRRRYCR